MTDPEIRPLTRNDLGIAAALIAAVDLFPPELLPDMAEPYLSGTADDIWRIASDGSALAYVAPERLTDGTWNLLLLAADPARQRQGLGRAMVAAIEADLQTLGARLLLVETSGVAAFAGQRRFYSAIGFAREARIRDYYGKGDDKIIYSKALSRTASSA
jgi:ribosomal protein S18 acetylase RimI-like enzyme